MPLGNSITHGVHGSDPVGGFRDDLASLLQTEYVDFDMVGTLNDGVSPYPWHEGHPGETANYLANHVSSWINQIQPDIVLLHIGTNDINGGYSNNRIQENIERILNEIWNHNTETPILLCSTIPRNDSLNATNTNLCRLIHQLAIDKLQQNLPIRYVGQNEVWVSNHRWDKNYLHDTFHPNNTGYRIMAEVYFNVLMNQITGATQYITDNFDRSNLGYTWKIDSHYKIGNHQLTVDTGGDFWWKPAIYIAEMNPITVTFTWGVGVDSSLDGNAGLALLLNKNTPDADGYLVYKESETSKLSLYLINDGHVNQLVHEVEGNIQLPEIGDEFKVAMYSDEYGHHFNCFVNEFHDGELTDPDRLQGNSSELFTGIMLAGTANNVVDNFKLIHFKNQAEKMYAVWGDEQQGKINSTLSDSLVVQVTDNNGSPIGNIPVNFEVTTGDATIETGMFGHHFVFEAENGNLTYPMQVMQDPEALGEQYIEVPEKYEDDSMAKAVYTFTTSNSGNYVIWGRVRSDGNTHDSFKVMIDQNPEIIWHISGNRQWTWDQVYVMNGEDPKKFYLSEGAQHTLTIKNREWGSKLDQIIITDDLSFDPNGTLAKITNTKITNASGKVYARVNLGTAPGLVEITASSPEINEYVTFKAYTISEEPAFIAKTNGDNQSDIIGQQLPEPFEVTVTDDNQNPVYNAAVLFEVIQGGGSLVEQQPVFTNEIGKATSTLKLGPYAGLNRVRASCLGYEVTAVIFEAIANRSGYTVSGNFSYFSNDSPIDSAVVNVTGDRLLSDTSTVDGGYSINNITHGSNLKIIPTKDVHDNSDMLISTYNAALIMQHVVKLDTLEEQYLVVADVDNNDRVQAYDAALISYYAVGLPNNHDSHVGEWIFTPPYRNYWNITTDYKDQYFTGFLLGDVNGKWNQSSRIEKGLAETSYPWLRNFVVKPGDTFTLPLIIEENQHMISSDVILKYDTELLTFINIEKTELTENFELVHNDQQGYLRIGLYSAYEMNDAGTIFEITFQAKGTFDQETALSIERFQINDEIAKYGTSVVTIQTPKFPEKFVLNQNYPNPFNPVTVIPYHIPHAGNVQIRLYNLLGQKITTLFDGYQQVGSHQFKWNGKDNKGNHVAGGIYICETKFENQRNTIKIIKLQ